VRRKPTPIEISSLDIPESNRLWRDAQRARGVVEPEEAEESR